VAHIDTFFQRPDRIRKPLHVVTTVFNSARYRSRWKLFEDFVKMCSDAGVELTVVEVAFGEREFALSSDGIHRLVQLRTNHELWLKENALNIGVSRLPADWKYVAWVDADITFARPDWADETMHALQHCPIVQMWSEAADMNSKHELMYHWKSLMNVRRMGLPTMPPQGSGYYYMDAKRLTPYPHAGYAWAARRDAWDAMGGLLDKAILGAADWHMAHGLLGQVEHTISGGYHPRYKTVIRNWAETADRNIKRNIGMVEGLVVHHWHGPKIARQYQNRNNILIKAQYNPDVDLKRDWQGLYQLTDRSNALRDETRQYLHARQEDAL
jgi:glycosyltransferase involved in cell wall biosynthesis